MNIRSTVLGLVVACALQANTPFSRAAAASPVDSEVLPDSTGQLAEIIVTAQKRAENLQNVPIAVAVVSGSTLQNMGLTNIADLPLVVPGLYATNDVGRLTFSVRGIGSNAVGPGIESPIALYIDGVYYASEAASVLSLNNISQVEVLKGPQGTLFGRNATGGLVQITTKEPTQTPTGSIALTEGNYKMTSLNTYLSGGILENLAADFALYAKHQGDGWGRNLTTGGETYNVDHDISVRSKWIFAPLDATKLTLIGDYENVRDQMITSSIRGGTRSIFEPGVVQPDLGYNSVSDYQVAHILKGGGVSLRWDQKFGALSFASISAYRRSDSAYGADLDAFPLDLESFLFMEYDKQFTQEFQLSSGTSGRLRWTGGLFYYTGTAGYDPGLIALRVVGINSNIPSANERTDSEAAYVQGTYAVTDDTNATLGGRFTHETHKVYNTYSAIYGIDADPSTAMIAHSPDASIKADKFTYRASVDHRFSPEALIYASISAGFKAGGFDLSTIGSPGFQPETLLAYEIGAKTDLFDERVRLNIAGFYYDYKNIQVTQYQSISIETVNGGAAKSYGLDVDFTALLAPGLKLTGGATLDKPTFTSFPGCGKGVPDGGVPLAAGDCTGNQLTSAPKASLSAALDYTFSVAGRGTLDLSANAYYNSGYYTDNANLIHQPGFAKLGAAARWSLNKHFSVSAFGTNLNNKRTLTYGDSQGIGTQLVEFMPPRTYGVTFEYMY